MSGIRTYIPTLLKVVRVVCVYTARNDAKIRANLPQNAHVAYDGLRTACDLFLALVPGDPIQP